MKEYIQHALKKNSKSTKIIKKFTIFPGREAEGAADS